MNIDRLWVPDGKLLGIELLVGGKRQTVWWRTKGREFADYNYSFASIAAGAATGWIDLQDAQNNYIFNTLRPSVINQFFIGVYPATQLMYLQFPSNVDRNTLTGYRAVDANGNGAIRGSESPIVAPSRKSELFTIYNLRPRLNIFNNGPVTVVPKIRMFAMMYSVEGPYVAGDPEIGDEDYLRQLVDHGDARITSIYGIDPANIPTDFVQDVSRSMDKAKAPSAVAAATAFARATARF